MSNLTNNSEMQNQTASNTAGQTEQPYNHDAVLTSDAIGIDTQSINPRLEAIYDSLPEEISASVLTEAYENNFSKREIAFIAAMKTRQAAEVNSLSSLFAQMQGE